MSATLIVVALSRIQTKIEILVLLRSLRSATVIYTQPVPETRLYYNEQEVES